ncbi:MAG: type 4a pilus biogenesis protein PilO [Candidatus Omnitrophica bacterium]|nr:type 4a pilus biogenesis protein PilO [Candidatus Omnitrophota bacterium]
MIKKVSKLTELGIFIGVFGLSLGLLYFFWGRTLFKATNMLKVQFSQEQTRLKEAESLIRGTPNPQKAIEEIEKKADEFKDMEINKKQVPRLVNLLGRSLGEHKINIVSIKPKEDLKTGNENLPSGVSKVYIEIVVNCSYRALGEYLEDLVKLPVAFTIESIEVKKREEKEAAAGFTKSAQQTADDKQGALTANLLLSTYMVYEL